MGRVIKNEKSRFGSMTALAHQQLKGMILSSQLAPGQKLLYADLENRLKMSKTPIISALNRLESEGYVSLKENAGYYVKDAQPEEIIEIMEARVKLEVANIDFVISNCTEGQLVELEKVHVDYCKYVPEVYDRKKLQMNTKFHLQLARLGGNRFMVRYIEHIYELFDLRVRFTFLPGFRVKASAVEHEELLQALHSRNKSKLKSLLTQHLKQPIKFIKKNLRNFEMI